jgi:hypothetical protein
MRRDLMKGAIPTDPVDRLDGSFHENFMIDDWSV